MKDRIGYYISLITLVLGFAFIALVTFWLSYPYKPIVINSVNVLSKEVNSGGTLYYEIEFCKNTSLPATTTRSFVNGIVFTTNTITTNNPTGCHKNINAISVPQEMVSGPYSLRTTWTYKVNPLRDITITEDSNEFQINGSDYSRQIEQK